MELDFFRFKFLYTTSFARDEFLELYNLRFEKVNREKVKEYQKELSNANPKNSKASAVDMDYYQVPFNVVLDLVRGRKVFLKGGMAFVPYNEIIVIIASEFRKSLSHCVALTRKAIPEIQEDERLSQILTDFDKRYTGKSYETKKGNENSVTMNDLPDKAKNAFPLCMKELYDVVEKEHHVKHFGRLQLGLFLKGVGLSMEEATKFWRSNFTKKAGMDGNRFDKQYLYNIRHMYGKEGKRADYTPYSCMKIIMSSVGTGDHHGCPFRHSDATPLRSRLIAANITNDGVKEIMKLVQEKHYQIACQKYFELRHGNASVSGGIHHPNQYFEESENVNLGLGRKARVKVETITTKVYAASKPISIEDPEEEWVAAQKNRDEWEDEDIFSQVKEDLASTEPTANATTVVVNGASSIATIEVDNATPSANITEVDNATPSANITEVDNATPSANITEVDNATPSFTTIEVDNATPSCNTIEVDNATPLVNTMEVGNTASLITTIEVDNATPSFTTIEVDNATPSFTTIEVDNPTPLVNTMEVGSTASLITTMEVETAASSVNTMEVENAASSVTTTEVQNVVPYATTMEVENALS